MNSDPLPAKTILALKRECDERGMDIVYFAWRVQELACASLNAAPQGAIQAAAASSEHRASEQSGAASPDQVREALAELVALKKFKEDNQFLQHSVGLVWYTIDARAEYERRKPLAWAAARTALGETT